MIFKLSAVLLFIFLAVSIEAKDNRKNSTKWKQYKQKHKATFLHEPREDKAFDNFMKNAELIEKHNRNPKHVAELGLNDFSHLSQEEINSQLKGGKFGAQPGIVKRGVGNQINWSSFNGAILKVPVYSYTSTPGYTAPASVDWTKRGFNTPVRSQSPCGNCWAFAATAGLEASLWKNLKTNVTLSPQQLTDCAGGSYGNNGCDGGFSIPAYNYIFQNGIITDSYYPFKGAQGTCSYSGLSDKSHGNLYSVSKMYMSEAGNDQALMELLDKYGPVTVGFDASSQLFNSYAGGVFASPKSPSFPMCTTKIDHAMLLVGYGKDNATGEDIWLIKNQWGKSWGIDGYMKVSRAVKNNCGISLWGVLPVATTGALNPTTVAPITSATTKSNMICDGKLRANPGCQTAYQCSGTVLYKYTAPTGYLINDSIPAYVLASQFTCNR